MADQIRAVPVESPTRELVDPLVDQPLSAPRPLPDRRQAHRYPRRVPAVLIAKGNHHEVTCLDVGYGGMLVEAPAGVAAKGDRVELCVDQASRRFRDQFIVCEAIRTTDSLTLHLSL